MQATIDLPAPPNGYRYRFNADGTVMFRQVEKGESYLYEGQAIAVWGSERRSNHHYFIIELIPEPKKIKSQFFRDGLWMARDKDGLVCLYVDEPQTEYRDSWWSGRGWITITDDDREHHPEVFEGPWTEAKFQICNEECNA